MRDRSGSICVFNGEIYNAAELAPAAQVDWDGEACDTEVLVSLLDRKGIRALTAIQGPFAVARYDPARGSLLLARDAVGKKPLYVAPVDGGWAFASTIRALARVVGPLRRRDAALHEYLVYRSVGGLGTAFQCVTQVPPGGWIELGVDGRRRDGRWWSLPEVCDEDLSRDEVRRLVTASVLKRHDPERLMSVFLSGGLDSAIVAATIAQARPGSAVCGLSIGYDVGGHEDETDYARRLAAQLQIPFERLVLSADEVPSLLADAAELTENPIQDPVTLPTVKLARFAASRSKVALTGDGSDEVWGGYARFAAVPDRLESYLPRTTIFAPGEIGLDAPPGSYLDSIDWPPAHLAPIDRVYRLEVANRMRNYHLARVDGIAMGVGLEPRSPFLDLPVVERGLRSSGAAKCPGGQAKGLLISAFSEILPDWLVRRKKQPFTVPIENWLTGPLADFTRDMLLSSNAMVRDILNPAPWLDRMTQGGGPAEPLANRVWALLQLEVWHQSFCRKMERG